MLIVALAKTSSEIGILPPIALTQTLIRLNAKPLPIKNLIPFKFLSNLNLSLSSFSLNF